VRLIPCRAKAVDRRFLRLMWPHRPRRQKQNVKWHEPSSRTSSLYHLKINIWCWRQDCYPYSY